MAKLNIFKQEWIDLVFEGRNKEYGAYKMRSESGATTTKAFFIGAALFSGLIAAPLVMKLLDSGEKATADKTIDKVIETAIIDVPPPIEDELPPPPPPPAVKSVNDQVKFPPPKVQKEELVRDEDPPTVEDLKTADPGQETKKGDPTAGDILIDKPVGDADKGTVVTETFNDNQIFYAVEVQAVPQGGMEAFYKRFVSNFNPPEVAGNVNRIRVSLSFVVEKDGSLTDIKVLRDGGYPAAGREAVRVLKTMPKWTAAVQNGRGVRSQFTLPITINIAN